jgi:hypothetical protein
MELKEEEKEWRSSKWAIKKCDVVCALASVPHDHNTGNVSTVVCADIMGTIASPLLLLHNNKWAMIRIGLTAPVV